MVCAPRIGNEYSVPYFKGAQNQVGRAIVIHFCVSGKEVTFRSRNRGRQPEGGGIFSWPYVSDSIPED